MIVAERQSQITLPQEQAAALQQALEQTRQALTHSQRENTVLRQKLDALARRFFGQKSEQLNAAQMELLLSGLVDTVISEEKKEPPARLAPPRSSAPSQRLRTPDDLEVVRQVIEPTPVLAQPEQWKRIGEEVSRRLDYQPGKFFWPETVRPKYVRLEQRALPPVIAPAPAQVADHSLAAPGLLSQILVAKYCDHPPFYRQEQIFQQRHGVFISRQQMVPWAGQSVRLLSAISDFLKKEIRQSGYVQVREGRAGPALRQAHRRAHSRMAVERLQRALTRLRPRYLPQSPMGRALSYALNQWAALQRFLDHGEVEIDNNLVENAIRPTALGKKNWLFFGSEEAGQRSTVIYTLTENRRRHGVEPYTYLKDVLERLPSTTNQEVGPRTPLNWKKAREAQWRQAA